MPKTIQLPPRLDMKGAVALWSQVRAATEPVTLDAADLRHVGTAGLQVLLMARHQVETRGEKFVLTAPQGDVVHLLQKAGLPIPNAPELEGKE